MKYFGLITAIASLMFFAACGGGGAPNTGTGNAGYSNANFSGNYVFTMTGECTGLCASASLVSSAGVLTADGKGNITGGNWDLNIGGALSSVSVTGTYSVNADGTASVTLNNGGSSDTYVMMLTSSNGGYIVSSDGAWALSGVVEKQSSTAQPTGNMVFRAAGESAAGYSVAIVGAVDMTSGNVTADMNDGVTSSIIQLGTATATTTFDTTTGRGQVVFNATGSLPTMGFVFYTVDGNSFEMVSNDALGMQGRAELGSGALTSGSILKGSFAFLGAGFPIEAASPTTDVAVSEGGIFTGDGAGNITGGTIDTVYDSSGETGAALTATGSVSTAGGVTRDILTTTTGSSTISMHMPVLWFVNSGRAFYATIGTPSDRAEAGTVNVQSGAPFSDNATFGFYNSGWAITSSGAEGLTDATLFANSSGTIGGYTQSLNLAFSGSGVTTGNGTLSFDSTGTLGSLTLNKTSVGTMDFRFYQYSSSQAFIMETDNTAIAWGTMTQQASQ